VGWVPWGGAGWVGWGGVGPVGWVPWGGVWGGVGWVPWWSPFPPLDSYTGVEGYTHSPTHLFGGVRPRVVPRLNLVL
jgi:hypothetical protein